MIGRTRRSKRLPNVIDHHVANRVRSRRIALGLTQIELAKMLGLSFQQIQKYEAGISRMSAGRLFELSRVLACPTDYFFDGLEGGDADEPQFVVPGGQNATRVVRCRVGDIALHIGDRVRTSRASRYKGAEFQVVAVRSKGRQGQNSIDAVRVQADGSLATDIVWIHPSVAVDL